MPGIVIGGRQEPVERLKVSSWLDDPVLRLIAGEDCRPRYTRWVRNIALHTTKGIPGGHDQRPQHILPGLGPTGDVKERLARYWASSSRNAGAHLVVDFDGSVACLADLQAECAYHAGEVNEVSIGIEICQGSDAELYDGQLDAVVRLVDWLTRRFRIQRQFSWPYRGRPAQRIALGARDVVGVFGHRDVTTNRGSGDPGDAVFDKLRAAGYEPFDIDAEQDLVAWMKRQRQLALDGAALRIDGVPGPSTAAALATAGYADGLWVSRPIAEDGAAPAGAVLPAPPSHAATDAQARAGIAGGAPPSRTPAKELLAIDDHVQHLRQLLALKTIEADTLKQALELVCARDLVVRSGLATKDGEH